MEQLGIIINGPMNGQSARTLPKEQTKSIEISTSLRVRPPLVTPVRMPNEIVDGLLLQSEKDMLIQHLINFQKSDCSWDSYRSKIPDTILDKFKVILKECKRNGFICPRVRQGILVWSQVLGDKRNRSASDECTLCDNNFHSGTCRGRNFITLNGGTNFKKCWERHGVASWKLRLVSPVEFKDEFQKEATEENIEFEFCKLTWEKSRSEKNARRKTWNRGPNRRL